VLSFALCRLWVDAPRVGGTKFLEDPFVSEGGDDLLTLSPSDNRPHGGSLPFERGSDGVGIVLGLLGHEGEIGVGGAASWASCSSLLRLTCPFERSNITRTALLISFRRKRRREI